MIENLITYGIPPVVIAYFLWIFMPKSTMERVIDYFTRPEPAVDHFPHPGSGQLFNGALSTEDDPFWDDPIDREDDDEYDDPDWEHPDSEDLRDDDGDRVFEE